jgi:hypothetical protein
LAFFWRVRIALFPNWVAIIKILATPYFQLTKSFLIFVIHFIFMPFCVTTISTRKQLHVECNLFFKWHCTNYNFRVSLTSERRLALHLEHPVELYLATIMGLKRDTKPWLVNILWKQIINLLFVSDKMYLQQ